MSEMVRCSICGAEGEQVLPGSLPCGHNTLEDVFGPFETLRVPSMEDEFGEDARFVVEARNIIARLEAILRAHAEKSRGEHPDLWQAQIAGIRAELNDPNWHPGKLTLKPLLRMLTPHAGNNRSHNLLPYYPKEYTLCGDLRNALMHEKWNDLTQLGGPRRALPWIACLEGLVNMCKDRAGLPAAIMFFGNHQWPWPQ